MPFWDCELLALLSSGILHYIVRGYKLRGMYRCWIQHRVSVLVWRIAFSAAITCTVACHRPVSNAPIIEHYRAATCIPVSTMSPYTRKWDTVLTLSDGSKVKVRGAQMPSGRITVSYVANGRESVAADPGYYVYPSDVRLDSRSDLLYVKARGLAGGISQQTWLFEYDLRGQRLLKSLEVADSVLPAECPSSFLTSRNDIPALLANNRQGHSQSRNGSA